MKRAVAFVLAAAVSLATTAADAQTTARALSRDEIVARVKSDNLELLAAKHRLSQARAEVVAAGVWSNPTLSANGVTATHGAITGGRNELVVAVDQVIPIAGQVGLRKDAARGYLSAEERAFAARAWELVSEAKAAYVELQRAQARAAILRTGLADLAKVEAVVNERAAAGANAPYDKLRVSAERGKVEARVAQADVEVLAARAALARAVGPSIDARTVTVDEDLAVPNDAPRDVDGLVRRALASRPDVASARARADAGDLHVAFLRRSYYPAPDVSVGYARYFDVVGSGGIDGGALVVGLSLPLPILDRGQGTIDRAIAEAAEDRTRHGIAELVVRRDVEEAASALAVRVAAWQRFRDVTRPDLQRLRGTAELAYREGRSSILELLDAYATYVDSEERALDLRAAASSANSRLEHALGPQ